MLNYLTQAEFSAAEFDAGRFNLHRHSVSGESTAVVLVHGLGGGGYRTWGEIPKRLFSGSEGPPTDVGIFDYRSGHRGIARRRGKFEFWVKQLTAHVKQVSEVYSNVFLVGHSLGGLLIEAVAMNYLKDRALQQSEGPGNIAALIVVASPRAGSGWAIFPLRAALTELSMLRRLNQRNAEVDEFFATHVERQDLATAQSGRVILPVYAVLGGGDKLVSQFSAAFGIPTGQRLYLEGGHRSIVKPVHTDAQLVGWLHKIIAERLEVRQQSARERRHRTSRIPAVDPDPRQTVVTQFMTDPSGLIWEELYNEARRHASSTTVSVRDDRDVPDSKVDLLIAVHDAALIVGRRPGVQKSVLRVRAEKDQRLSMSVGICPVGEEFIPAEGIVHEWLAGYPPVSSFYVNGALDAAGFRGVMQRLLQLVIGRDPLHAVRDPLNRIELERLESLSNYSIGGEI